MKNNCFIDFDGTIICNKDRLFRFFTENIDKKYRKSLTKDEFWNLKRLGINEIEWINKNFNEKLSLKEWNLKKSKLIEEKKYLNYNKLFDYSMETLKILKNKYNIILVTRRSNKVNLIEELEKFNLNYLFDNILVVPHGKISKAQFILKNNIKINKNDIFIGDTEDDLYSAIELNIKPYMVKSGIRSEWIVSKYFFDRDINIINNISDLIYL